MNTSAELRVEFYASLGELMGQAVHIASNTAPTPLDLWKHLCRERGLELGSAGLRVAVDDRFVAWDSTLGEARCVAFMPPFAGG